MQRAVVLGLTWIYLAMLLHLPRAALSQPYAYTPIVQSNGYCYNGVAVSISNDDALAGYCDDETQSFLDVNGEFTSISGPPDYTLSYQYAEGVNINHTVIGVWSTYGLDVFSDAYIFSNGSYGTITCQSLGLKSTVCGGVSVGGINDDGKIVGTILGPTGTDDPHTRSGILTETSFSPFAGRTFFPTSINNLGQVAGFTENLQLVALHGVTYLNSVAIEKDAPGGKGETVFEGINDNGLVLGYYRILNSNNYGIAKIIYFTYDPLDKDDSTAFNYLPASFTYGNSTFSPTFTAINNSGTVTGNLDYYDYGLFTATPATPTTSYYVRTPEIAALGTSQVEWMYLQGYDEALNEAANQQSAVLLQFGDPRCLPLNKPQSPPRCRMTKSGYVFGATGYGNHAPMVTVQQILADVEAYAAGFYDVAKASGSGQHLTLLVATTNEFNARLQGSNLTGEHGAAWASMVNGINTDLAAAGMGSQVVVAGSQDVEPEFAPAGTGGVGFTTQWGTSFDRSAEPPTTLIDDPGIVPGCVPNGCSGWTEQNIASVLSLSPKLMPQVYRAPTKKYSGDANSWLLLSLYQQPQSSQLYFVGTVTTSGACDQIRKGCGGINQPPQPAWNQLSKAQNNSVSIQNTLQFYTDIRNPCGQCSEASAQAPFTARLETQEFPNFEENKFVQRLQAKETLYNDEDLGITDLGMIEPIERDRIGSGFKVPATSWRGYVDGVLVTAAGSAYEDNPGLGVIYVEEDARDVSVPGHWKEITKQIIDAPYNMGFVTITGSAGGILSIRSGLRQKPYQFDLRTLTFK